MEEASVEDWARLVEESRALRPKLGKEKDSVSAGDSLFLEHFRSHRQRIAQQLLQYQQQQQAAAAVASTIRKNDSESDNVSKSVILKTRKALRLGLSYLSVAAAVFDQGDDDEGAFRRGVVLRRTVQEEGWNAWQDQLLGLFSTASVDHRCIQLAAQVLCNLVTDSEATACKLATKLPIVPSMEAIAAKILVTDDNDDNLKRGESSQDTTSISWVDLLLTCASFRPALASMVACLHNCLASLSGGGGAAAFAGEVTFDNSASFVESIASSSLLVSTLLRQIVSAQSVQQAASKNETNDNSQFEKEWTDDATEWISLTIAKLSRAGFLPRMYQAVAGRSVEAEAEVSVSKTVLPEQIVLLHCIRESVEDCRNSGEEKDPVCGIRCDCLGGGVSMVDGHCSDVEKTHLFLVRLFLSIRNEECNLFDGIEEDEDGLRVSALQLIADILAETLSEDSRIAATVRLSIGRDTALVHALLSDLGSLLDHWLAQNDGKQVRDQVAMSDDKQRYMTTVTRVLGNLCFRCQQNQDLLRTKAVPLQVSPGRSSSSHSHDSLERNGLHVLLSTTSMSYTCFTLREWAVVAIRSALENNRANQAVVAELEARSAVQSTELEDMGIRVDLDVARGQVSVAPVHNEDDVSRDRNGKRVERDGK